jgi:hypothetical protein
MRNPGSEGLTTDRVGDADQWVPEGKAKKESLTTMAKRSLDCIVGQETK